MSRTPEPNDLAEVAGEQHLAGRHHAALDALRPYFVGRELNPAVPRPSCATRWTFRASCVSRVKLIPPPMFKEFPMAGDGEQLVGMGVAKHVGQGCDECRVWLRE